MCMRIMRNKIHEAKTSRIKGKMDEFTIIVVDSNSPLLQIIFQQKVNHRGHGITQQHHVKTEFNCNLWTNFMQQQNTLSLVPMEQSPKQTFWDIKHTITNF